MQSITSWLARHRSTCGGILATAASQFLLAYVTLSIQSIYPVWSAPFWPASGAALAAVILRGPWMLVGVYLGLAVPNMTLWSTSPVWLGFVLPIGNVLETAMALFLLHQARSRFDFRFGSVKDVGWFLVLAPWIPAACSALFVQTFLWLTHIVPSNRLAGEVLVFWLGNSTGIMLVTPLLLVWRDIFKFRWQGAKGLRILFLLAGVALAVSLLHAGQLPSYIRMTSVLVVPYAVWGIWATGFRGATLLPADFRCLFCIRFSLQSSSLSSDQ